MSTDEPAGKARRHISFWSILKQTVKEWNEDKVPRLGAALAYYATFSLTPLLMLAIAVASIFYGEEAARGELEEQLTGYLGENGASAVQALIGSAKDHETKGMVAVVLGIGTLLFGASGVFNQLKESLNTIWGVQVRPGHFVRWIVIDRLLAFAMVLLVGLLLVVSLFTGTAVETVITWFGPVLAFPPKSIRMIELLLSFLLLTVLFAAIFKILPDIKVMWKSVWLGAVLTSILFVLGKFAIALYISKGGVSSSYGAAGSLVVIMIWVYYSSQILFLGAEFTQVYTKMHAIPAAPSGEAVAVTAAEPEITPSVKATDPHLP